MSRRTRQKKKRSAKRKADKKVFDAEQEERRIIVEVDAAFIPELEEYMNSEACLAKREQVI